MTNLFTIIHVVLSLSSPFLFLHFFASYYYNLSLWNVIQRIKADTHTLYATITKNKPAVGGKFEFTGAALYYTYYAEVGSAEIESESTSDSSSGRKKSGIAGQASQSSSSESKLKEDRLEKFHEFFAPFEIPRNNSIDKPVPISDFDL